MLAGTAADGLLLDNVTVTPPGGAVPANVTVPRREDPPVVEAGRTVKLRIEPLLGPLGLIVRVADALFNDAAVIMADVGEATAIVDTENVAVDWPTGIVRLDGTVAEPLELLSVTETPPAGAGALRATVPLED